MEGRSQPLPAELEAILYRGPGVRHIRHLGEGKAAQVSLVNTRAHGLVAEKHFTRGGIFARLLYKVTYQSPLPYHCNPHAVASAFYTRKILRELTKLWYGSPRVADALYLRRHEGGEGWILGTEFIDGRGPDPNMREGKYEIRGLKDFMDDLSGRLMECGLYGVMWQTDKTLSIPTSNFIRNTEGHWILIDIEPGLPGIALFGSKEYLRRAKARGLYPIFGDVDLDALRSCIHGLKADRASREALKSHYTALEHHLKLWKNGERSSSRTTYREVGKHRDDEALKEAYVKDLCPRMEASPATVRLISGSWPLIILYLMICDSFHTFFTPKGREMWLERRYRRLEMKGRVPIGTRTSLATHTFMSLFIFKEMHRWLVDPKVRRQYEGLGVYYLTEVVGEWDSQGRLLPHEKEMMLNSRDSASANMRGFGYHLILKPLSLIFDSVSIGGVLITGSWTPLLIMLIAPFLRVCVTIVVWAQERMKGRRQKVGIALIVGGMPKVGILGFPAQLYRRNRSVFSLMSDNMLSGLGERVPVFGATNSTLEHWFIRRNPTVREKRFYDDHRASTAAPGGGERVVSR